MVAVELLQLTLTLPLAQFSKLKRATQEFLRTRLNRIDKYDNDTDFHSLSPLDLLAILEINQSICLPTLVTDVSIHDTLRCVMRRDG